MAELKYCYGEMMSIGEFIKINNVRQNGPVDFNRLDEFPRRIRLKIGDNPTKNTREGDILYMDFIRNKLYEGKTSKFPFTHFSDMKNNFEILEDVLDIDKLYEDIKEF